MGKAAAKGELYMTTYVTVQGDTWDSISSKLFGSSNYIPALINPNQKHMHVFIFSTGVELLVPDEIVNSSMDLPPWKRGVENETNL